eukprot:14233935-Ditylum_brightwellii.AAC.1
MLEKGAVMFFNERGNGIISVACDVVGEKEDLCDSAESSSKVSLNLLFQEGELLLHGVKNLAFKSLAGGVNGGFVISEVLDLFAPVVGLSLDLEMFKDQ